MVKNTYIENYMSYQKKKSPGKSSTSIVSYRSDLIHFATWFEAKHRMDMNILNIRPIHVHQYKQHLIHSKLPYPMISRKLQSLKYFMEWGFNTLIDRYIKLLQQGNYEQGFAAFESRRICYYTNRKFNKSVEWQGENLYGKTILLYPEQGLGDMILFIRFADLLHNLGAKVLVEMYPRINKLFSHSFPYITFFSPELTSSQEFDYHSPLMSIPSKLNLSRNQIASKPYLIPIPEKVEQWNSFLRKDCINIGILWHTNSNEKSHESRCIPLHFFKSLADIKNVQLYSMQKNYGLEQLDDLSNEINIIKFPKIFDEGEDTFLDSIAIMKNLDLVVTCDTSIAHLGGACGCPTWVALKHSHPYWVWGLNSNKTCWYDSIRLFRQKKAGDWSSVFSEISKAIQLEDFRVKALNQIERTDDCLAKKKACNIVEHA